MSDPGDRPNFTSKTELRDALNEIRIGGNHLANYLIGKLGGDFATKYPPDCVLAAGLMPNDVFDVWICWAAIMRSRKLVK